MNSKAIENVLVNGTRCAWIGSQLTVYSSKYKVCVSLDSKLCVFIVRHVNKRHLFH